MTITIPGKEILKIKVPGVLALALLAGELLITNTPHGDRHYCKIKVEQPHTSTFIKERKNVDVLKLNITTQCELPQKYTILNANIQAIVGKQQITAHEFYAELRTAVGKDKREARFRDLQVRCTTLENTLYLGRASGEVHLANGDVEKVSGNSKEFVGEECKIDAK